MPVTGSPQWYTLVTSLILGVGIGCLAQPQLVVRFMMVESTKQLNRGVLIGCVFLIVTVGAIYHVGALSNLFFLKTEGVVASEAIKDMDKIIPLFIDPGNAGMVQCRFHALYLVGKYVYAQRPVPHDGSFFRGRHIP